MTVNKPLTIYYGPHELEINRKYNFSSYVGGFNTQSNTLIVCYSCFSNIFILEKIDHKRHLSVSELDIFCIDCLEKKSLAYRPIYKNYFKVASKTFDKLVIV
jgi:hypothetical protein